MPMTKRKKILPRTPLILDEKYLGSEPTFSQDKLTLLSSEERETLKAETYNWYNYFYNAVDLHPHIVKYIQSIGELDLSKALQEASDKQIKQYLPATVSRLCRMHEQGWILLDSEKEYILNTCKKFQKDISEISFEQEETEEIQIPTRKSISSSPFLWELDKLEDLWIEGKSIEEFSIYSLIDFHKPSKHSLDLGKKWIQDRVNEFENFKEDYTNFKDREKVLNTLKKLLSDLELIFNNKAAEKSSRRKPRTKKKVRNPEKILKNFKYARESSEFKLKSIDPQALLGAKRLYTFDVRYRKLQVYEASEGGFSVKGTTLTNFVSDKSIELKLRKPDQILSKVFSETPKQFKVSLDKLSTKTYVPHGRVSENILLLKVDR